MPVIDVDRRLTVLEGQHRLHIRTLTLSPEAFEVAYTITPPLPDVSDEGMVLPRLEAIDDAGRTYDDGGGAFGSSDDGTRTEGTISVQPGLPPEAREVVLRFGLLTRDGGSEHELTVALP